MFNVSDKVRINEELCPENKRTEKKFQFGALNYLAIMLDWEFEVVREFNDEHHGAMIECTIINVENIRSNVVLKSTDVVLAQKTMVKMDFEILGQFNKFQDKIDSSREEEKILVGTRTKEKAKGTSITAKALVDNWNAIKSLRASIKKLEESPLKIFKVKHKLGTYSLECKEEDIPSKLRALIRASRRDQKLITPITKYLSGGMSYQKVGGVLIKPNKFVELNEKFATNIIKEQKTPKTPDSYVGIEIEMVSSKSIAEMNKEFIKARLHRLVNIGTDGSIRVDGDDGHAMELRLCIPENLLESKLKEICEVLRRNDCYANRSCGMHVHLDMRNRDPELCYKNFFKVQGLLLSSQPSARRSNQYCRPNTKPVVLLKDFDKGGGEDGRRQVINTTSYNKNKMRTIEIRVHEGATKFKDVFNWVKFLVATASLKTELVSPINNGTDLRAQNYVEESVIKHLETRVEEYSA